ncbi:MAG: RodZ domain-containing protein [Cellvibrionaceae bacterium]
MSKKNNNAVKNTDKTLQDASPGEMLSAQRKKLDIDEKDAAESLKITISRLRSIESDDYRDLPSETYVRGYLRNYGRLVDVDEHTLIDAYDRIRSGSEPAELGLTTDDVVPVNHHKQWWFVYVVLVILVMFWVASYWLFGNTSDEKGASVLNSSSTSSLAASNEGSDLAALSAATVSSIEVGDDNVPSSGQIQETPKTNADFALVDNSDNKQGLVEEPPATQEPSAIPQPSNEQAIVVSKVTAAELVKSVIAEDQKRLEQDTPPVTIVSSGDTLNFGFENDCWVKVSDSTGTVLFAGLQKAGTALALNGKAPFRVIVGNVEGTSLVYNGEPVQLSAESNRKSARLQVGG